MEEKLSEYRARKRREQIVNNTKETIFNLIMWKSESSESPVNETKPETERLVENIQEDIDAVSISSSGSELEEPLCQCTYLNYVLYILYFIFWVTVYVIFIKLGFGIIYLIISALIGIYLNTRTSPKKKGEVSAYSVFNKDCESIDGTLKAEQFEREIRYGGLR